MEWVAAAEAEAERVAQAHIVMANQANRDAPLTSAPPRVSEYVEEKSGPDTDEKPQEVSEKDGALAPATKRRVVRRK